MALIWVEGGQKVGLDGRGGATKVVENEKIYKIALGQKLI